MYSMYTIPALGESTDIADSAKLQFFISIVISDFQCYEKMLSLGTFTERTQGIGLLNLFKVNFCKTIQDYEKKP